MKLFILLITALIFTNATFAAVYMVTPTTIILNQQVKTEVLKVTNQSNKEALIQFQLFTWDQKDNESFYTPSHDLIISPPFAKLKPWQTQIVRIGLLRHFSATKEHTYRLFIREILPNKRSTADDTPTLNRLRVALCINLPVFVNMVDKPIMMSNWQVKKLANSVEVRLINTGNLHLFINELQLIQGNQNLTPRQKTFAYVLPGHSYKWIIPIKNIKKIPIKIIANINEQMVASNTMPD